MAALDASRAVLTCTRPANGDDELSSGWRRPGPCRTGPRSWRFSSTSARSVQRGLRMRWWGGRTSGPRPEGWRRPRLCRAGPRSWRPSSTSALLPVGLLWRARAKATTTTTMAAAVRIERRSKGEGGPRGGEIDSTVLELIENNLMTARRTTARGGGCSSGVAGRGLGRDHNNCGRRTMGRWIPGCWRWSWRPHSTLKVWPSARG